MSFDNALDQLRNVEVAPPSFTEVEQRRRWKAEHALPMGPTRVAVVASAVAALGYLALCARPLIEATVRPDVLASSFRVSVAALFPALLIAWSIRLVRRASVGPQMLARAIWWSNLVVGALITWSFSASVDRLLGAGVALACAVAILGMQSHGLDRTERDGVFQPTRFRGQLLLALVMAFADAQTLLFSALMQLRIGMRGWNIGDTIDYAGPATLAALVMGAAVWGLYRLRTWALFLNLIANFAIAFFALEGFLNVSLAVAGALAATAACQAFLPVPILAAALGDRNAGKPLLSGHAPKLLRVSVVLIALFALASATASVGFDWPERQGKGWLKGPGRAFVRGGVVRVEKEPINVEGHDLSGQHLGIVHEYAGASMRGADLSRVIGGGSFAGADMREVNLTGASLRANFNSVRFGGANLTDANMSGSHFNSANFHEAMLVRTNLRGTRLGGATFSNADLTGADLTGTVLSMTVEEAATITWSGATCPDGQTADERRGCVGHEGQLPEPERGRFNGAYERSDDEAWREDAVYCREGSKQLRKAVALKHLYFADKWHVRTGTDTFNSYHATLVFDRSGERTKIIYEHEDCGTLEFTRVD